MPLLTRVMELRSSIEDPTTSLANPATWLTEALGGGSATHSGVRVNEERAMRLSAVYACVRVVSEDISTLPVVLREKTATGNREVTDHPVHALLERPNPYMTWPVWSEAMQANLELWGNAYAEIERDGRGDPIALWPIQARRVTPKLVDERKVYRVDVAGQAVYLQDDDVMHVPGLGWDGVRGLSPVKQLRQSLGLSLAAEEFGARYFGSGTRAAGVLQGPGHMSDEAYARLRASWEAMYKGLDNQHRTAILEGGFSYQQIGVPPEDSQFLETRKFQVEDAARAFRVPLVLIGHTEKTTSWGTGVEQFMRAYVTHSLRPRLVKWEAEMRRKLLRTTETGLYVHFRVEGLLRGDMKARFEAYQIGRQNGWLNGNDIRALEDQNPVEGQGLDLYLVNGALVPADQAGQSSVPASDEGRSVEVRDELRAMRQKRSVDTRRRLQQQHVPLFREAAQRFVRREVEAVRAAVQRELGQRSLSAFDSWVEDFYDGQQDYVQTAIRSLFLSYGEMIYAEAAGEVEGQAALTAEARDEIEDFVDLVASKQVDYSIGQIRALVRDVASGDIDGDMDEVLLTRLDEWEETRAEKFATRETVTLAGLASVLGYAYNGVRQKRWVTFGESCPLCSQMDGRTVSVRSSFLDAGAQLEADGASTYEAPFAIRHPQLHGGCDCSLVADI